MFGGFMSAYTHLVINKGNYDDDDKVEVSNNQTTVNNHKNITININLNFGRQKNEDTKLFVPVYFI